MLVLSRKPGEKIVLAQGETTITVIAVAKGRVRIGISAPKGISVHREEVWSRIVQWGDQGSAPSGKPSTESAS